MSAPAVPTVRASDTTGLDIHIGPHDVFRNDPDPIHKDTIEADVHVDAAIPAGRLVVIMWHAGAILGAVVYDRDDRIRRVA